MCFVRSTHTLNILGTPAPRGKSLTKELPFFCRNASLQLKKVGVLQEGWLSAPYFGLVNYSYALVLFKLIYKNALSTYPATRHRLNVTTVFWLYLKKQERDPFTDLRRLRWCVTKLVTILYTVIFLNKFLFYHLDSF